MLRKSIALAAGFTAALSLLDLNTAGPVTFGLSKAETSADAFTLYGTLDASAADATNAQNLGSFTGATPQDVLDGYAAQAATWPYVLVQRTSGTTAGTFYVTGDQATAATVASQAAPTSGNYTAVFDLTGYSAAGVRIGGDRNMTAGDVFLVYASEDATVTSSTGCKLVGRITGGGGTGAISCLVKGYPYAIVQRSTASTASTAGNILAAGVVPPVVATGTAYVQGGNAFGATGVLGLTDAQTLRVIANNTVFAQDDGTITTIGRTAGAASVVINAGTGNIDIGTSAAARTIRIGTGAAVQAITIGSTTGASSLQLDSGTGTINIGTGNQARTINIGTGTAAQTIVVGSTDTTSSIKLDAGTGNIDIGTSAAARTINIGTGAAAQTVNLATGNAAHTINIGTGTTNQTINIGTGAGNTITIGNTSDLAQILLRCSRGVGINTASTPDVSAILELVSTTRGLLLPRMTTTQRDAIGTPASGLLIYNTTTNKLNFRAAAAWEAVTSV